MKCTSILAYLTWRSSDGASSLWRAWAWGINLHWRHWTLDIGTGTGFSRCDIRNLWLGFKRVVVIKTIRKNIGSNSTMLPNCGIHNGIKKRCHGNNWYQIAAAGGGGEMAVAWWRCMQWLQNLWKLSFHFGACVFTLWPVFSKFSALVYYLSLSSLSVLWVWTSSWPCF